MPISATTTRRTGCRIENIALEGYFLLLKHLLSATTTRRIILIRCLYLLPSAAKHVIKTSMPIRHIDDIAMEGYFNLLKQIKIKKTGFVIKRSRS